MRSHDDGIVADGKHIKVLRSATPADLPWGELGVEVVVESTGFFTDGEKAGRSHRGWKSQEGRHLRLMKNADGTFVMGVNEADHE